MVATSPAQFTDKAGYGDERQEQEWLAAATAQKWFGERGAGFTVL